MKQAATTLVQKQNIKCKLVEISFQNKSYYNLKQRSETEWDEEEHIISGCISDNVNQS